MNSGAFSFPMRQMVRICGLVCLLVLMFLAAWPAQAKPSGTITVTNGNDNGPGSLRQAVSDAKNGDTIMIEIPTSSGTAAAPVILLSSEIVIVKNLTIKAPTGVLVTLESGNNNRLITNSGKLTLDGLAFLNGRALGNEPLTAYGGAIINFNELVLKNAALTNNWANGGGGAIANLGKLTLESFTAEGNRAVNGGGGFVYNFASGNGLVATVTIREGTIRGNTALGGGAFYNGGNENGEANMTLERVNAHENSANSGGAVYNESANGGQARLWVSQAFFDGNNAVTGGTGISSGLGSVARYQNVTFFGSSAEEAGLVLASAFSAQTLLAYITLVGSVPATGATPDIAVLHSFQGGTFEALASIFANESDTCDFSGLLDLGYNLASDGSCLSSSASYVDPKLTSDDFSGEVAGADIGVLAPLSLSSQYIVPEGEARCNTNSDPIILDANSNPRPSGFYPGPRCIIGAHQPLPSLLTIIKKTYEDNQDDPIYFDFTVQEFPNEPITISGGEQLPILIPAAREIWLREAKVEGWELDSITCTENGIRLAVDVQEQEDAYAFIVRKFLPESDVICTVRNRKALPKPIGTISFPLVLG